MEIQELMDEFEMKIDELIEMMKFQGDVQDFGIIDLPNNKYAEWSMMLFRHEYYATYTVLDQYEEICYYEDIVHCVSELKAREYCQGLEANLDGENYG